jgi:hypothetical protein
MRITFFLDVNPCSLVDISISNKHAVSIVREGRLVGCYQRFGNNMVTFRESFAED